jgi:RNA polymerase I-specific transcription initiation factor RRN3
MVMFTRVLTLYVCRIKPAENDSFSARFMAYLFNKIQQKTQRNANQMASAAYLGSFLSRASYVPSSTLRLPLPSSLSFSVFALTLSFYSAVVTFILNWTLSYINTHPNASPDAVVHGLYYSMSQSLYYIFCFHHKSLLASGDVDTLKRGYRKITESRFNPLKVGPTRLSNFAYIFFAI